jgi:hypothetical protein
MPKIKEKYLFLQCIKCGRWTLDRLDEFYGQRESFTWWAMSMDSTCTKCWKDKGYKVVVIGDNWYDYMEEV